MSASDIIDVLWRINFATGAAILGVATLRKFARRQFGARVAYGLWVLPVLAGGAVLAPARQVVVVRAATHAVAEASFVHAKLFTQSLGMSNLDPSGVLVGIWLLGALCAGLAMTELQRRFMSLARRGAVGPAVVGVVAPRIIIPADFDLKYSAHEQTLILAHEQAHIARQDSRLNGLCAAFQCLCWFNPLIHLAAHLMRIDQELASDEVVSCRFPGARRVYAEVLMKAQLAVLPLPLGCHWPSRTQHPLMERVAMLKLSTFSPARRFAGICALAFVCAGTGFAAWAAQPADQRVALVRPADPAPAGAELAHKRDTIDITSKYFKNDNERHLMNYSGNVELTVNGTRLMSDSVNIYVSGSNLKGSSAIQTAVASRHVIFVTIDQTAKADHAVYDFAAGTLTLTGHVIAFRGHSETRTDSLTLDVRSAQGNVRS